MQKLYFPDAWRVTSSKGNGSKGFIRDLSKKLGYVAERHNLTPQEFMIRFGEVMTLVNDHKIPRQQNLLANQVVAWGLVAPQHVHRLIDSFGSLCTEYPDLKEGLVTGLFCLLAWSGEFSSRQGKVFKEKFFKALGHNNVFDRTECVIGECRPRLMTAWAYFYEMMTCHPDDDDDIFLWDHLLLKGNGAASQMWNISARVKCH